MDAPRTINDLAVGQVFQGTKLITKELIRNFAQTTGYLNPIHLDEEFARKTVFGKLVAQGALTVAILFGTMGTQYPGVGTIPLSQTLKFVKPVLVGDELTIRLKILGLDRDRNRVNLETVCFNQQGEEVLVGEAWVLAPRQSV
jgi:3-hydroxybutyryl-CoA dehydratase